MKRALAAEAQLAERTRERNELKEWSDAAVAYCAKRQCSMRDARLRESEDRAESAERRERELREAMQKIAARQTTVATFPILTALRAALAQQEGGE